MDKTSLFNELFDQFFDKVYSYFAICFNKDTADDLAQQTFMNVWKYIKSYGFFTPNSWKAWIFRTAVNVKTDFLRQKQNRPLTFEYSELKDVEMRQSDHEILEAVSVERAFSMLGVAEKELLLLKNMGFSSSEMGRILNIPSSTVRSRLAVAKEHFKKALNDCGVICDE